MLYKDVITSLIDTIFKADVFIKTGYLKISNKPVRMPETSN